MKTDYKFWYIQRADDVHINECAIRIFEGEVTTKSERNIRGSGSTAVTRYRRTRKIPPSELNHFSGRPTRTDAAGNSCLMFTSADFGEITTNDELRTFINNELKKDTSRTPIPEQV